MHIMQECNKNVNRGNGVWNETWCPSLHPPHCRFLLALIFVICATSSCKNNFSLFTSRHLTPWEPWFPWWRHGPDDLVSKTFDWRIMVLRWTMDGHSDICQKRKNNSLDSVWLLLRTTKYGDSWQFGVENMCFQTVLAPSWYFRLYKIGPESIFKWQCC